MMILVMAGTGECSYAVDSTASTGENILYQSAMRKATEMIMVDRKRKRPMRKSRGYSVVQPGYTVMYVDQK